MPQDGVIELFRRGMDAWNRDGVSGVLPFFQNDVVAHPFPEWPGEPIYRGHDGFRRLASEWTDQFDHYSWEEERVVDAGDATVVGLVYHRGQIKGTEVPIKQPMGTVWKLVEDKAEEVFFFLTWAEALEAVGLAE
jgi:hypothetical protein